MMIDSAVVDIAHVMGKLSSNTANDPIYDLASVAKRAKMFSGAAGNRLRLQPDIIYSSKEGFLVKPLEARFFHINMEKSITMR